MIGLIILILSFLDISGDPPSEMWVGHYQLAIYLLILLIPLIVEADIATTTPRIVLNPNTEKCKNQKPESKKQLKLPSVITRPRRVRRIIRTAAMRKLRNTSQDTSTYNNTTVSLK